MVTGILISIARLSKVSHPQIPVYSARVPRTTLPMRTIRLTTVGGPRRHLDLSAGTGLCHLSGPKTGLYHQSRRGIVPPIRLVLAAVWEGQIVSSICHQPGPLLTFTLGQCLSSHQPAYCPSPLVSLLNTHMPSYSVTLRRYERRNNIVILSTAQSPVTGLLLDHPPLDPVAGSRTSRQSP